MWFALCSCSCSFWLCLRYLKWLQWCPASWLGACWQRHDDWSARLCCQWMSRRAEVSTASASASAPPTTTTSSASWGRSQIISQKTLHDHVTAEYIYVPYIVTWWCTSHCLFLPTHDRLQQSTPTHCPACYIDHMHWHRRTSPELCLHQQTHTSLCTDIHSFAHSPR